MYLDSAILVKLLVREADSAWFNRELTGHEFVTSELALTEVRSALLAKERAGHITARERAAAGAALDTMAQEGYFRLFPLNRLVLDRASAIQLACHPRIPLRALDALHVATCDLHHSGVMATTDARMRSACAHFGITLLPAQMEDVI
jgi:predicted nucleic acid-binding protein